LEEVEEFVTGVRHAPHAEPVLATLLSASFELARGEYPPASRIWQRLRDHIDRELEWSRGRECQQGTQSLLASFDGPARAVRCACAIAQHASRLGIGVRVGLHIGECEITSGNIRGAAVDIARQIAQHASPGEILVSTTVRDLVAGSGIRFQYKEELDRGSAVPVQVLAVETEAPYHSVTESLRAFSAVAHA